MYPTYALCIVHTSSSRTYSCSLPAVEPALATACLMTSLVVAFSGTYGEGRKEKDEEFDVFVKLTKMAKMAQPPIALYKP